MNDSTPRVCSVEFFPPATDEGAEKLRATRALIDKVATAEGKNPAAVPVGLLRAAYADDAGVSWPRAD